MSPEEKNQIRRQILQLKKKNKLKDYGDVVVEQDQTFTITTLNSRFKTLTLKDGATLEIDNSNNSGAPIVLNIRHLFLESLNKTSYISLAKKHKPANLNGSDGPTGPNARDGYRTNRGRLIGAQHGFQGYKGEDGTTIETRGILHFTIRRLWVTNETPLSAEIFQMDGIGFKGGDGGNGGRGGKGGNGGPGITGRHSCGRFSCSCTRQVRSGGVGGNGGDGGFPGNGANGGSGASLLFFGKTWLYNVIKTLSNLEGGAPGVGGFGGSSGTVGTGAASVHGGGGHCGRRHPKMRDGYQGINRTNIQGTAGEPGKPGTLIRSRTEPKYEDIMDQLLEDLETGTGYFAKS